MNRIILLFFIIPAGFTSYGQPKDEILFKTEYKPLTDYRNINFPIRIFIRKFAIQQNQSQ